MPAMLLGADLICSDEACAESAEAIVFSLGELDVLVCDGCGCTLELLALWEVEELRARVPADALRRAA
jgi:hypothetical protein